MIRYIHGSEDSVDLDVFYVFESIPSISECKKFCFANPMENRNIITIDNGVVSDCFIGTIDETNNGLLDTYSLHHQDYPLLVTQRVPRDVEMKMVRATRGILSLISRTQYREDVKKALKSSLSVRLKTIHNIDFSTIDFFNLDKQLDALHSCKVIAFQVGQSLGLLDGIELYTKSSIAKVYPQLTPFLYREQQVSLSQLNQSIHFFIEKIYKSIPFVDVDNRVVQFLSSGKVMELKYETYV